MKPFSGVPMKRLPAGFLASLLAVILTVAAILVAYYSLSAAFRAVSSLPSAPAGVVALPVNPSAAPVPVSPWPQELRDYIKQQCMAGAGFDPSAEPFCACVTEQLEQISPDPETPFRPEEIRLGVAICRAKLAPPDIPGERQSAI